MADLVCNQRWTPGVCERAPERRRVEGRRGRGSSSPWHEEGDGAGLRGWLVARRRAGLGEGRRDKGLRGSGGRDLRRSGGGRGSGRNWRRRDELRGRRPRLLQQNDGEAEKSAGARHSLAYVHQPPSGLAGFGRGAPSVPAQLGVTKFSYCLLSRRFDDDAAISGELVLGASSAGARPPYSVYYYTSRKRSFKTGL